MLNREDVLFALISDPQLETDESANEFLELIGIDPAQVQNDFEDFLKLQKKELKFEKGRILDQKFKNSLNNINPSSQQLKDYKIACRNFNGSSLDQIEKLSDIERLSQLKNLTEDDPHQE